jgi:hypothetical protein
MAGLNQRRILVLAGLLWLIACFGGSAVLLHYSLTPSDAGKAVSQWPASSALTPFPGKTTLVVFAHPHCPCTRATLVELNILMQNLRGKLGVYVLFIKPQGLPEGWEKTDILASAQRIPGVETQIDEGGIEAARFGAATSGQAMLFDQGGHLLFNGGITQGRGHIGENEGFRRIASLVQTGQADKNNSLVFGCALTAKFCPTEKRGL